MKTILLLICGLLSFTFCRAQVAEYSFKESYNVSVPATLSVSSSDGNIEVLPGDETSMQVFYTARRQNKVLKITREELEKELTLTVKATATSLVIEMKYPPNYGINFTNNRIQVDFKVYVPARTACDLHSSDGNIALSGLSGQQDVKTSDGNIQFSKVKGNVSGSTSDGNVQVSQVGGAVSVKTSDGNIQLEKIDGNVQASTSDGNIALASVTGDAQAKTSDGDIAFSNHTGGMTASTSDGNIKGSLLELKTALTIKTSDGNIDVTLPDGIGMDLDIHGDNLNVPVKNFTGTSDENAVVGKVNGGGVAVKLSSGGNVAVHYR